VKYNGCDCIAVPMLSRQMQFVVSYDQSLWELTSWMPGTADFRQQPTDERLQSMMETLARFHLASAQLSLDFRTSPNLQRRHAQLSALPRLLEQIRNSGHQVAELHSLRQWILSEAHVLSAKLSAKLHPFLNALLPIQPVIRDIRHEHVLFTDQHVTGIVDFGAMQTDNVALDLSRLLGSMLSDQPERWQTALNFYQRLRKLTDLEIQLIPALDESGALLGAMNWLKWIEVNLRRFENWEAVVLRINELQHRLEKLTTSARP
jgi:Ser/Thr protein kinase RdoA (MazF antagonist)